MRHPAGHLLRMRCLGSPPPPRGVARPAVSSRAARVVLAWAVLAGLFFMHGAASPGGGCRGGAPVTGLTVAAAPSPSGAAAADSGLGAELTVIRASARSAGAVAARQLPASASPASTATAANSDPCCGRMLCLSRQPRQGFGGAFIIRPAAAVIFTAALMPLLSSVAVSRRARPPGRRGLPLPLFLGVSRT